MSQMVGAQAVFNVISGTRYKIIPTEIKNYVKGLYGKTASQQDVLSYALFPPVAKEFFERRNSVSVNMSIGQI
ncbi:MAG: pycB [Sedimentibacter sp.]|nr:pycB [Sedimentibacter sp.]